MLLFLTRAEILLSEAMPRILNQRWQSTIKSKSLKRLWNTTPLKRQLSSARNQRAVTQGDQPSNRVAPRDSYSLHTRLPVVVRRRKCSESALPPTLTLILVPMLQTLIHQRRAHRSHAIPWSTTHSSLSSLPRLYYTRNLGGNRLRSCSLQACPLLIRSPSLAVSVRRCSWRRQRMKCLKALARFLLLVSGLSSSRAPFHSTSHMVRDGEPHSMWCFP